MTRNRIRQFQTAQLGTVTRALFACLVILGLGAATAAAANPNFAIVNYTPVNIQSAAGGKLEVTFTADLLNLGPPASPAVLAVLNADPFLVRVWPGQNKLLFNGPYPAIATGQTVPALTGCTSAVPETPSSGQEGVPLVPASPCTFTLIVDPNIGLDYSKLQWKFIPLEVPGPTATVNGMPLIPGGPILLTATVGAPVTLDASAAQNLSGEGMLTWAWRFVSRPPGAKNPVLVFQDISVARFTPDVPGTYVIELAISNCTYNLDGCWDAWGNIAVTAQ